MRYTITNFSRGEFAPELYGRVDVPQYSAGARELTNFIIQRYGGVAFRPGFRFVGEVDNAAKPYRYIPFQFSIEQAFITVHGDYSLRLLASGGFVTEDNLKITAITKAVHAVITAAHHDMVAGDRVYVDGVSGMIEINGKYGKVLSVAGDNITTDIDTRGFTTFTSSTGIVRTADPTPPTPPPAPAPAPPPPSPPPTTTGTGGDGDGSGTYGYGSYSDRHSTY